MSDAPRGPDKTNKCDYNSRSTRRHRREYEATIAVEFCEDEDNYMHNQSCEHPSKKRVRTSVDFRSPSQRRRLGSPARTRPSDAHHVPNRVSVATRLVGSETGPVDEAGIGMYCARKIREETRRGTWDSHHDECRTDDDSLDATAEDGVRDDGQCLVGDHVREEQRDEEEMAVLADGLDLVGVLLLFAGAGVGEIRGTQRRLVNSRCATYAQHIQLSLVERHVAQR